VGATARGAGAGSQGAILTSTQVDMGRCPACNRLIEWRKSVAGTRFPVDGVVLIHPGSSGKEQVLNKHGVVIHSAKVVKEDGESAWLLHQCLVQGKLSRFREIGGGSGVRGVITGN